MGPMVIEGIPYFLSGKVIFIRYNMKANPLMASAQRDFFGNAVALFHTLALLDTFAKTGDPNYLPTLPELQDPLSNPLNVNERTFFSLRGE